MILFKQMIVLFLLMLVGFICRKIGLLNDTASGTLSAMVVNVANPALVLSAGINPDSTFKITYIFFVMGLTVVVYAFLLLCAVLYTKIFRIGKDQAGVYRAMVVFSNVGFMGFPIVSAMYGSDALLLASLFFLTYNVLMYTYGISTLSAPEQKEAGSGPAVKDVLKKVLNIGVIACILAIVLYITQFPVPSVIEDTVDYLSNLAAPLSMIVIGDSLTQMKPKQLIGDRTLLVFTVIKLLVIPAAGVLLLKGAGISGMLLGICVIMLATPVGSMTAMVARQYGGDYELASRGIAITTVLSVITVPLISLLA